MRQHVIVYTNNCKYNERRLDLKYAQIGLYIMKQNVMNINQIQFYSILFYQFILFDMIE